MVNKRDHFFEGKVAVITGASSGIGKTLAFDLTESGCKVVMVARNRKNLEEIAAELNTEKTMVLPADVTDYDEVSSLVDQVIKEWGRIDILINCAGIFKAGGLGSLTVETIQEIMEVNYNGTINCVKASLPYMLEQGGGSIVLLSSLTGRLAFPGCAAYGASKFALYGFANIVRPELKKHGIHMMAVYPSFVDSPLVEGHIERVKNSFFFRISRDFSPQKVSRAIMKGIKKKKREMVLPPTLGWTAAIYGLCPRPVEYFISKLHGGWPDPLE